MDRFTGVLGILAVLTAAWLFSTDRKRIRWRTVAWGLGLQIVFAFLVLRFSYGEQSLQWAGDVVKSMLASTYAGTKILFGPLGVPGGTSFGSIFAFQVLPTIIFISAFFAVLYHIGLMQIMPTTWAALRRRYSLGVDPYDAHDNILGGTALLRELYDRFGANGFLAAYNAGSGAVDAANGVPDIAETRDYVDAILKKLK